MNINKFYGSSTHHLISAIQPTNSDVSYNNWGSLPIGMLVYVSHTTHNTIEIEP